jgi:hypothetical protein
MEKRVKRGPGFSGQRRALPAIAIVGAVLASGAGQQAVAQSRSSLAVLPPGIAADTLRLDASALFELGGVSWGSLAGGERVATWVIERPEVGNPGATGRPVLDAPADAVVASFAQGRAFGWPDGPVVWTAPREGPLVFGLNAVPNHEIEGEARVVVVPLGVAESAAQQAFPAPMIELERAPGGAVVRYRDRGGFGLAPSTLSLTLTTSRGVTYHLSSWAQPGERETFLPLPPPEIPLPAGVHRLTATILDRAGNSARSGEIAFDAVQ